MHSNSHFESFPVRWWLNLVCRMRALCVRKGGSPQLPISALSRHLHLVAHKKAGHQRPTPSSRATSISPPSVWTRVRVRHSTLFKLMLFFFCFFFFFFFSRQATYVGVSERCCSSSDLNLRIACLRVLFVRLFVCVCVRALQSLSSLHLLATAAAAPCASRRSTRIVTRGCPV
jgi:hypothetical protein